jgi:hypothetical protein
MKSLKRIRARVEHNHRVFGCLRVKAKHTNARIVKYSNSWIAE